MKRFVFGFSKYFSGLRFWTSNKRLVVLSIIPFMAGPALFVVGLFYLFQYIPQVVGFIVQKPEFWYQNPFYYFVAMMTGLILFLILVLTVYAILQLLLFPFNDLLAEKTLSMKGLFPPRKVTVLGWVGHFTANFLTMLWRTILILVINGLVFFMTLIPGLGFVGICFGLFVLAFNLLDYSFDPFKMSLKERLAWFRLYWLEAAGFSCALGLTFAVPVLNMFLIPGSVVAASCLVSELPPRRLSERTHT